MVVLGDHHIVKGLLSHLIAVCASLLSTCVKKSLRSNDVIVIIEMHLLKVSEDFHNLFKAFDNRDGNVIPSSREQSLGQVVDLWHRCMRTLHHAGLQQI